MITNKASYNLTSLYADFAQTSQRLEQYLLALGSFYLAFAYQLKPDPTKQALLCRHIDYLYAALPIKVASNSSNTGCSEVYRAAFEVRRDIAKHGRLTVFDGNHTSPIFDPQHNFRFRAVHDYYHHSHNGADFTLIGEYRAYLEAVRLFTNWYGKRDFYIEQLLFGEIVLQAAAYFITNGFPEQKLVIVPSALAAAA